MFVTILSWIYIFAISLVVGIAINKAFSRFIPVPSSGIFGTTGFVVTGLVTLTVYAEVFSIFYKVGAVCHILMLVVTAVLAYFFREDVLSVLKDLTGKLKGNRLIIYAVIILASAFFTSRGTFHTDTGIYHAQTIRLMEEYGVIKGLGNLQVHYAYNSSYLALCALFTLSFILPFALHTMTGFFMALFACYASEGLMSFAGHKRHGGDMARVAILIYCLTNMTGLQSPATDYGTMFMALYILCAFISYAEEKENDDKVEAIAFYGYLSVLSIFVVSMKLSAALLVILAIVPFVFLVQKKMWKEIGWFLLIGFLSFLPYLVRNVILSGWLFYPVASIDLFNVEWKIPVDYMIHDADQIKVWGKCLYDVSRVNDRISSWFPIWWEEKQHYEEMLVYSQVVGVILLAAGWIIGIKKKRVSFAIVAFYGTVLANIAMWFVTAPFIRYGLAFLLILPLCAVGDVLDLIHEKKNVFLIAVITLIAINFFSWIDNYFMDDLVFVKHYISDGYYITPVPFEDAEMTPVDMDGLTVYVAGFDEVNSYYTCPGSCYDQMVNRTELIGDTIYDGFKAK